MISTYARAFLVTATCSSSVDLQKTREESERDNPKVVADSSISLMISCFLLTLLGGLRKTGSRLLGGEACTFFPFKPSLLVEVGGILGGTLEEWSSHLSFLFRTFLGVGWAEEERTFCPEGEDAAERFRMPEITRSGLMLSARLRFKLALGRFQLLLQTDHDALIHSCRSIHPLVIRVDL